MKYEYVNQSILEKPETFNNFLQFKKLILQDLNKLTGQKITEETKLTVNSIIKRYITEAYQRGFLSIAWLQQDSAEENPYPWIIKIIPIIGDLILTYNQHGIEYNLFEAIEDDWIQY